MTCMLSMNSYVNLRVIFAKLNIELPLDLILHNIKLNGANIIAYIISASC